MARRIQLSFDGKRGPDVLLSLDENKFYSYEQDRNSVHGKWGGKPYYTSHSGLTGVGYIQPPAGHGLIRFGTYRVDAVEETHPAALCIICDDGVPREVSGLAPVIPHEGIQWGMPFVLTDGDTVAFVRAEDVISTARRWDEVKKEASERRAPYFRWGHWSRSVVGEEATFRLHNPRRFRGVNALRFAFGVFRRLCPSEDDWKEMEVVAPAGRVAPATCSRLELVQTWECISGVRHDCWLHLSRLGVFDAKLAVSPLEIKGKIVAGWIGDGHGLVWRRRGELQIVAIMEVRFQQLLEAFPAADLAFSDPALQPEWVDVETEFSVLDWFTMNEGARRARLLEALMKEAQRLRWAIERPAPAEEVVEDDYVGNPLPPGYKSTLQQLREDAGPEESEWEEKV